MTLQYLKNQNTALNLLNSKKLICNQKFKEVEGLPERERSVLLEIIGAYIRDFRTKQAYVL